MPDDMPNHVDWDAKSASSQGLPGCWASVDPGFLASEKAKPLPPVAPPTTTVVERSIEVE
jgi:hypothetical protein